MTWVFGGPEAEPPAPLSSRGPDCIGATWRSQSAVLPQQG